MKSYNWKKGILVILVCGIIGAIGGGMLSYIIKNVNMDEVSQILIKGGPSLYIVSFGMGIIGLGGYFYCNTKLRRENYCDEENSFYEKLDECEKHKVGKASYQTITVMISVYVCLFVICYTGIMMFDISPIICLPIGILWIAQTLLMLYYGNKKVKN